MTAYLDDLQLVRAYHEGDSEAFRELFKRYKLPVLNFALRFIGNRADAEDVTSEVFLQFSNKKFTPTGEAKLSTWLFTVARNASLTRLRALKNQVSFWMRKDNGEDEQWDVQDPGPSVTDSMKSREMLTAIHKAIAALPSEQREAIILREYHDRSYAEIAEITASSLEKVKILIFRARETLRVQLARFLKEA